ncbi:DUF294 nucleotidyltransferase-like domain-containing protein [Neobacillus ginsengisoli]|uniref:CBS domain-containing protein n=1 Tax=Neobacillus ginsengisoli TaxID=904295 RepID=A0ABT9Y084_9BACI|nr:DUF294 nucleotidyltransferase-like domain-containing protein [Neobacillus ginsengisoli]MDQ0200534.1 CBS domain-containing protein [Neobacillus ginsengisoli]
MEYRTFSEIRKYRESQMKDASGDHFKLNQVHEDILLQVLNTALYQMTDAFGPPPSLFSFFVMGSAGRYEQSVWSDQDHGIIYEDKNDVAKVYFLALGKEISDGLHQAGYKYCDGGVMSCNPLWCKSLFEWEQQIMEWTEESSWESIRHLLILIDARAVTGEQRLVENLKTSIYQTVHKKQLLPRFLENTLHLKKGIGVLGQILTETHGVHTGSLNIKDIALFPYVNAIRLLAVQEKLMDTSTLSRLDNLHVQDKELYKTMFLKLLHYRLKFGNHTDYESGHYLQIDLLTKEQKKEIKDIIKNGAALYHYVIKKIVKRH